MKRLIETKKWIVLCGTGGVGKTTVSATLAVAAARMGRNTAVITIDPAKRLATSLGISSPTESAIDLNAPLNKELKAAGHQALAPEARLSAIIPDSRRTLEQLVRALSPSEALAERLASNPIFDVISREFSGAHDILALLRLRALARSQEYETIILDTPPSRSLVQFLQAPAAFGEFFQEKMIRLLVAPSKLLAGGMQKAFEILESLTGAQFVKNLYDFASSLFALEEKFTQSVKDISELFQSQDVAFVLVTTPSGLEGSEINELAQELKARGNNLEGILLNRSLQGLKIPENPPADFGPGLQWIRAMQAREESMTHLKSGLHLLGRLPEQPSDVYQLKQLVGLSEHLLKS